MTHEDTTSTPTPSPENRVNPSDSDDGGPTAPSDRIVALDALRGFALLGILVINIWLFGLPTIASFNPALYGNFTGVDYLAWLVSHVFFEQKFVTLFTFMFGAGIVLFLESKERKGQPGRRIHFARTFWLLVIGLGHAYLLWYGDILVFYALSGFLVVWVWRWRPSRQFALGAVMFALPAGFYLLLGIGYLSLPADGRAELEDSLLAAFGATLSPEREIEIYQSGWLDQLAHRVPLMLEFHTVGFVFEMFWMLGGLMIVGMALYKWGIITNARSTRFYRRLFVGAGGVGLGLVLVGVWVREAIAWQTVPVLTLAFQFNYWGAPLLATGYLAGIMLLCRWLRDGMVVHALAAVGRTAFTNYLLQTLLATTIFYGHGLGLFGQVRRVELLGVVVLIWALQISLSVWWLRRFRFGPVEWVWRTLTYRTRQPMRLEE
ncbi:DUF418 domain-containing protein [Natrarchaeobaculum sulfurireducens]|uniref:Inner membrane protein n=1 Tax=Natrarchaeobaculum sulfurireducens TaxID=2044521 RepID=A0A346PBC4_9EURY|nr:DUF418 domain-containing protein [Natrarchaeobaculum sulfurireducens]AXR76819.1 hypothetical protein AArc1_0475 [Natrarchaeobaculum sulfurireducens]AXR80489.1 Putative inner membrane protein [Natrarchaeobaculum sulfurireducens]